jgi:hypothetical protein
MNTPPNGKPVTDKDLCDFMDTLKTQPKPQKGYSKALSVLEKAMDSSIEAVRVDAAKTFLEYRGVPVKAEALAKSQVTSPDKSPLAVFQWVASGTVRLEKANWVPEGSALYVTDSTNGMDARFGSAVDTQEGVEGVHFAYALDSVDLKVIIMNPKDLAVYNKAALVKAKLDVGVRPAKCVGCAAHGTPACAGSECSER